MKQRHSKGPWTAKPYKADPKRFIIDGVESFFLADVYDGNGSHPVEANAKLIAAAPDLLAALQIIASQSIGDDWTAEQAVAFVKQFSREVIAKAVTP